MIFLKQKFELFDEEICIYKMSDNSLPSLHFQDPKLAMPLADGSSENQQKSAPPEPQHESEPSYSTAVPDPLDEEPDVKYIIPFLKFY